jgi:lysophospholipase L1-like esterase
LITNKLFLFIYQEFEVFANKNVNRKYANIWDVMLNDRGAVNPSLFIKDGLHMNKAGYEIWDRAIRPFVES